MAGLAAVKAQAVRPGLVVRVGMSARQAQPAWLAKME
jgi:hypothetical protein